MKEINNQEIQKKKEEIPKREIKNFNFGLTGKLIVTILIPLIIGIWINSIISMFCIYYFHPKMIDTAS